ncbi:UDP-3-O-acyl-N-acetylglucosamine deacetylase [Rhodospirillaceae bacterium SYSU D60014]|uniref:UDP-3-O-acyl-N-acetylglucosamine deacetylase n=1 Tax=Virgifigura deserti TaxID=2268457 RepID=UPI000E6636AC
MASHVESSDYESSGPRQRTLKNAIQCSGVSLHSGNRVSMTMRPAAVNTGIVFRRTDVAGGSATIEASWRNIVESTMCTALGNADGVTIATVEHLMAALAGCGIDNLLVEIDGAELPIMDGSASPFVFLAECAGIVEQDAPRAAIRVLKPVRVGDRSRSAALVPGPDFSVRFEIEYDNPAIAHQECVVQLANGTFKSEISRARTYGFLVEVESLRAAGLAQGASLDNAVVIDGDSVLNEGGLRYRDEFVRHKVLDSVGDLYLAGAPLIGHFHGRCSGHKLNHQLLWALFADSSAWCFSTPGQESAQAPAERIAAAG